MGDHYRRDAGLDRFAKGTSSVFSRLASEWSMIGRPRCESTVGVAVAGKMFRCRDHILALNAFDECDAEFRNRLRIFAKAANIYHRIFGVVIDVEDRSIDVIDADSTGFAAGYYAHSAGEFDIAGRRYRHRPRKIRGVLESHSDSCFGVERHQQRNLRRLLHTVDKYGCLVYRCSEKYDAADLVFYDFAFSSLKTDCPGSQILR